jgi:hypothetical protein
MADTFWWIMSIIAPVVLLIALVWLVFLRKSGGTDETTFKATKDRYADEERRRREGTDDL